MWAGVERKQRFMAQSYMEGLAETWGIRTSRAAEGGSCHQPATPPSSTHSQPLPQGRCDGISTVV